MAITYLAGNNIAGLANDKASLTTTYLLTGTTFLETDTDDLYQWDGDSWNVIAGDAIAQTLVNKTLTSPVINTPTVGTSLSMLEDATIIFEGATNNANETILTVVDPTGDRTVSLPDATDTLVGKATTDVLTNKTLTSPVFTTPQINDSNASHQYIFGVANLTADRTVSLPLLTGNDTFTFNDFAGTLTNKTIDSDSNTITNIVNADVKAAAGIVDTKLATIATGNKVSGSAVQLSGTSAIEDSSGLRIKDATAGAGLAISSQVLSVGVDDSSIEINSDAIRVKATGVTNAMLAGSIVNGKLSGPAIAVTDGSTASNIAPGGTLTFAATANETTVAQSGGTVTIGLPNNVAIAGTLTVNGSTTLINSTTVTIDDPIFTLGGDTAPGSADTKDRGVEFRYFLTGDQARVGFFGFDNSAQAFTGFTAATNSSEVFSGTVINAVFGNITAATQSANNNSTYAATTAYVQTELADYASDSVTFTNKSISGAQIDSGTVADARIAATLSRITGTETLTNKTLTAPKFADGGFIADAAGLQLVIFDSVSSAVNEVTVANAATGDAPSIKASGETNIGLNISGKGTGGVTLTNATANGAYLEFDTKAAPANPATEAARMYLKQVDANNNAMAVKLQKGGVIVEVEITSPRAVCAECGGKDGAKDPLYDFERGVMVLDLWCGHSFEVPMQWSQINGNN